MRTCICCGRETPSKLMFACWEHWNMVSPEIRSLIVKAHARGALKIYERCALEAIRIWKEAGAWHAGAAGRDALRAERSGVVAYGTTSQGKLPYRNQNAAAGCSAQISRSDPSGLSCEEAIIMPAGVPS